MSNYTHTVYNRKLLFEIQIRRYYVDLIVLNGVEFK